MYIYTCIYSVFERLANTNTRSHALKLKDKEAAAQEVHIYTHIRRFDKDNGVHFLSRESRIPRHGHAPACRIAHTQWQLVGS